MPPKIYLTLPKGDFRAMPVYTRLGGGLVGVKWICVFPENAKKKLPSVIGNILLNDAETGRMLALIQASTITAYRTGSAGAVASRYLAVRKPQVLALVGAGVQSEYQLKCHLDLFDFKRVTVWSPFPDEVERFLKRTRSLFPGITGGTDLQAAVRDADIICTCTPSRKAMNKAAWYKPGCPNNANGAVAPANRDM